MSEIAPVLTELEVDEPSVPELPIHPVSEFYISISALKTMSRHGITTATKILEANQGNVTYPSEVDTQAETAEEAESQLKNLAYLDDYRQARHSSTPELPIESPVIESPVDLPTPKPDVSADMVIGPTLDDDEPEINFEAEAIIDLIDRGFSDTDEIDTIAKELGIEPRLLALHLQSQAVEIEDLSEEPSHKTYSAKVADPEAATPTMDPMQLFLNTAGRYPLLTAHEEVVLAKAIERGSAAAKERMVNSNLRLVVSIAKNYQGHGLPLLDLVQDGVIGLNRAAEKFDWRMGYKFSTYATWWIRQAVQRAVQNQAKTIRIPVHILERQQRLRKASDEFSTKNGRQAEPEELAKITRIKLNHVEEALEAMLLQTVSLNKPLSEGGSEMGDLLADEFAGTTEDEAIRGVVNEQLREALSELPSRERVVLELRFGFEREPCSLEEVGREIGLTRERVRHIEKHALETLQRRLEGEITLD